MKVSAPQIWPDCKSNIALTCEVGDANATDEAFARATHIVCFDSRIHRVTGSPMEPRSVLGEYDKEKDFYTLHAASGRGAVQTRERLAVTLGVEKEQCRAVFGDMGGNFGTRNAFSPEFALMPWAAYSSVPMRALGGLVLFSGQNVRCCLRRRTPSLLNTRTRGQAFVAIVSSRGGNLPYKSQHCQKSANQAPRLAAQAPGLGEQFQTRRRRNDHARRLLQVRRHRGLRRGKS